MKAQANSCHGAQWCDWAEDAGNPVRGRGAAYQLDRGSGNPFARGAPQWPGITKAEWER